MIKRLKTFHLLVFLSPLLLMGDYVVEWTHFLSFLSPYLPFKVHLDNSNNIYVCGSKYIVKFNQKGGIVWIDTLNSPEGVELHGIASDRNGYIYLTGKSDEGCLTVKYSPEGNLIWLQTSGLIPYESGNDIVVNSNNNIYVLEEHGIILKYNPDGKLLFYKKINMDSCLSLNMMAIDSTNALLVVGENSRPDSFCGHIYLYRTLKLDSLVNILWERKCSYFCLNTPTDIVVDPYGYSLVVGYKVYYYAEHPVDYCVMMDSSGTWQSFDLYIPIFTSWNEPRCAAIDGAGRFYIGERIVDMDNYGFCSIIIKCNHYGDLYWYEYVRLLSGEISEIYIQDMAIDGNNNIFIVGYYGIDEESVFVEKISNIVNIPDNETAHLFLNAPSLCVQKIEFTYTIEKNLPYTISVIESDGRIVKRLNGQKTGRFRKSVESIPGGVYFIVLKQGRITLVRKVLLLSTSNKRP